MQQSFGPEIVTYLLTGLINFYAENNPFKLWIPENSDFVENNEWLEVSGVEDLIYSVITRAEILSCN